MLEQEIKPVVALIAEEKASKKGAEHLAISRNTNKDDDDFEISIYTSNGVEMISLVKRGFFNFSTRNVFTKNIVLNYINKITKKNDSNSNAVDYTDPNDSRLFIMYSIGYDKCVISFNTVDISCFTSDYDHNLLVFDGSYYIENNDMLRELYKILPLLK